MVGNYRFAFYKSINIFYLYVHSVNLFINIVSTVSFSFKSVVYVDKSTSFFCHFLMYRYRSYFSLVVCLADRFWKYYRISIIPIYPVIYTRWGLLR